MKLNQEAQLLLW